MLKKTFFILLSLSIALPAWGRMSKVFGTEAETQELAEQEEVKQEEPKQEETKQEEVKQEEPKQEEPKKEEPKQEPSRNSRGGASSVFGEGASVGGASAGATSVEDDRSERPRSTSVFGGSKGSSSSYSSSGTSSRATSVFGGKGRRYSSSRRQRAQSEQVDQSSGPERTEQSSEQASGAEPGKVAPENPRTAPQFLWPVDGGYVSSFFGWRNSKRFHDGIDIMAPKGTKIFASKSGQVIYSASKIRGYGNMIVIRHNEGFHSVYAHNSSNKVRKGDIVSQGDVIGLVGNTGHSSGPHLHFEIRKGKYSKDPLKYLGNVPGSKGAYRNNDGAALWK